MANVINLLGKEFEFFWSTQAVAEISEKCGGLNKLSEWVYGDEVDDSEQLIRFTYIFETLINAAIKRDNYAIKHGFMQGEEKEMFAAGDLSQIIGISDVKKYTITMFEALNIDLNTIEIPADSKVERKEIDETLEEIEDARAKKEESGE